MAHDVNLPLSGLTVKLIDRSLMKANGHTKVMRSIEEEPKTGERLPSPPPTLDLSKGRAIKYPPLGNHQYGDCFYADACHHVQTWTGQTGTPATFDEQQVINAYLKLAGGDNGLTNDQIMGEWRKGLVGGPHKILDDMVIPDPTTARLAAYLFSGTDFTLAIPNRWLQVAQPGATWDAQRGDRPNQANGHAVHLSGYTDKGFNVETWGFANPILMTDAGVKVCDPEFLAEFSLDMFDPTTHKTASGHTYDEAASFWRELGGAALPPSPWGDNPPPPPPPYGGFTGTLVYANGALIQVSASHGPLSFDWQKWLAIIQAILNLLGGGATMDDVAHHLSLMGKDGPGKTK